MRHIATSPGLQLSNNIPFNSYVPKNESKIKKPKSAGEKDFLLHSTVHRSLDYTVKAETPRGTKPPLNHFFGIYDPETGKLQVVEAKKMVIRGTVRAKQASAADLGERTAKQVCLREFAYLTIALIMVDYDGTQDRPWTNIRYQEGQESYPGERSQCDRPSKESRRNRAAHKDRCGLSSYA